jgi:hypothetical protein
MIIVFNLKRIFEAHEIPGDIKDKLIDLLLSCNKEIYGFKVLIIKKDDAHKTNDLI